MNKVAGRLIFPLAVVSIAVAAAVVFSEPSAAVAVVVGAVFEARVQRERAKRITREGQLLRGLRAWRVWG